MNPITPLQFASLVSGGKYKIARHLVLIQKYILEAICGTRQGLLISVPPRSGKSELISKYLPAWYLGSFPDRRVFLATYQDHFSAEWGRKARDILSKFGPEVFGVHVDERSSAADRWNILNHDGGMMTAGAGGSIVGKGAHLFIIDDPIKSAEEAYSQLQRDKMWEWWFSSVMTRLEPGGFPIVIMHRWHEDDLIGRLLNQQTDLKFDYLRLPALAEENDPLGRQVGEALWPERYPRERLLQLQEYNETSFAALYQQSPCAKEGNLFKSNWFQQFINPEERPRKARRIRYWDRAATGGEGDFTCGLLMSRSEDGIFTVENIVRGKWNIQQRDAVILETARRDEADDEATEIWIEQEPAGSGKESFSYAAKNLEGYRVYPDRVTGAKEVRAGTFASAAALGRVRMVRADWNFAYIAELTAFPYGRHDDSVDASSGAFNRLARRGDTVWTPEKAKVLSLDGYKGPELKL